MRSSPPAFSGPSRPGRRAMLGGTLGAAALVLSGCDVRLEDDAPPLPLIPTREPIPAEPALLWLLEDCRNLADKDGPRTELYAEQVAVLRSALFRAGIPIETLDEVLAAPDPTGSTAGSASAGRTPTATASAGPIPSPTSSPTSAPAEGSTAALTRVDDLARCGPGMFPVVMSLLAQRWAAVRLAGDEAPQGALVGDPGLIWRFSHLAAGFVEQTTAAVYGFEIVAAQTEEAARDTAVVTLADLRRLRREQTVRAGARAPAPALGYPLPFPVDSEESALRLAEHVLTGLTDGYAGLLTTVTGAAQEDTAQDVVGWLGAAAAHGVSWGVPLEAFPGTHATE